MAKPKNENTNVDPNANQNLSSNNVEPATLEEALERIKALEAEKEALTQEKSDLFSEKEILTQEKDALITEKDALNQEKDALANDRDILKERVDKLEELINSSEEDEYEEDEEEIVIDELGDKIDPYMWLQVKPSDIKAKITCVIPAGSDSNHPYNRYELDIVGLGKIVMREDLVRALFGYLGITGLFHESLEETISRLEAEKLEKETGK